MKLKSLLIIIYAVLVATAGIADANTIEDFFRNREISNVQLSPNGAYLAALVRTEKDPDAKNLVVWTSSPGNRRPLPGIK